MKLFHKEDLKKIKTRYKVITFLAILIGAFVITDTPPVVIINKTPYIAFLNEITLRGEEYSSEDVKALKHMRWLKEITIHQTLINDVSFLNEMNLMEDIFFGGNINEKYTVKDWTPLSNCKKLENFCGYNMGICDLNIFKDSTLLKQLYVESLYGGYTYNTKINDISDVKYLVNLEAFGVSGKNITGIYELKYCTKLKSLTLYGTTTDADYSVLLELPNLEHLVIDKGVMPQEQLKTLREKGVKVYIHEVEDEE